MTYEVWHADVLSVAAYLGGSLPNFPDGFRKVAEVDGLSLDDAFRLTNSIDANWAMNAGVNLTVPAWTRSTSVGDVIVERGQVDTGRWLVAPFGFTRLP